jgi:hypothetical protein
MAREVPASKTATLWRGNGRWFQRRDKAYYAVAKALVLSRYPMWLDDPAMSDADKDERAKQAGIADRSARLDRAVELFYDYNGAHFRVDQWQRYVKRVARFLMFVDDRRKAAA